MVEVLSTARIVSVKTHTSYHIILVCTGKIHNVVRIGNTLHASYKQYTTEVSN